MIKPKKNVRRHYHDLKRKERNRMTMYDKITYSRGENLWNHFINLIKIKRKN